MEIYMTTQELVDNKTKKVIECGSLILFEDEKRKNAAVTNGYVREVNVITIEAPGDTPEEAPGDTPEEAPGDTPENIDELSVAKLKALAIAKGVDVPKGAKKAELVNLLK